MFEVNVESAIDKIRKESSLSSHDVKKATYRAINRSLTKGRTETSKSIRNVYVVKSRDIKKNMKLSRASITYPTGSISASTHRMPLSMFKPSQRRDGVSVRIKKKRQVIKRSFLASTSNNFTGVFMRGRYDGRGGFNTSPSRLPITSLVTSSMYTIMKQEKVIRKVGKFLGDYFPERMLSEVRYISSRR